uniref:Fibrillar collagen NC1 domain-containing protein n=1 Tax=Oryzias latipes TaxID=8090 RepID=A0A3P9I1F1_ORYLA
MKLLQLLSRESHQNVTYRCKNSVAVKDEKSSNFKKSSTCPTDLFTKRLIAVISYFSFLQKSSGQWAKTVIEYRTQTSTRLPIVDLAPMDIGQADQEFGLDIGPVCFL